MADHRNKETLLIFRKIICDGSFYVWTCLGHRVPIYLVKHYSECFCEFFWIKLTFELVGLSKADCFPNVDGPQSVTGLNRAKGWSSHKEKVTPPAWLSWLEYKSFPVFVPKLKHQLFLTLQPAVLWLELIQLALLVHRPCLLTQTGTKPSAILGSQLVNNLQIFELVSLHNHRSQLLTIKLSMKEIVYI